MSSIVKLHNLKKNRTLGDDHTFLLSDVTVQIVKPEIIAVLGASGQGKSTLLRILAKLDIPDGGQVLLHDKPSNEWDSKEWRMRMCYIAQQAVMLPGTVEDNLRTVSNLHRLPFDERLARELMNNLGLDQLDWKQQAELLSGGEKQRVSLIRSLLMQPEILLLDEVTASLDSTSKQAVENLLLQWHKTKGTILIWVTHDIEQAKLISDRIWFIGGGTLLEDDSSESFFAQPATELGRQYLHMDKQGVDAVCH